MFGPVVHHVADGLCSLCSSVPARGRSAHVAGKWQEITSYAQLAGANFFNLALTG